MTTSATYCAVLATAIALGAVGLAHASAVDHLASAAQSLAKRPATNSRTPSAASVARAASPVVTTEGTAPGQAGYVHYFVITGPDGDPESHVGIELPGDRIAWSFPEVGVVIADFIKSGSFSANGKPYTIEHLYGIKPFSDAAAMRLLQRELAGRVALWVDDKTAFCSEELPPDRACVSCLGFVLRVLYPTRVAHVTALPALPAEFKSARKNVYTTEDLLLYLTGIEIDQSPATRNRSIEALAVPNAMKQELLRISSSLDIAPAPSAQTAKPAGAKARSGSRSVVDLPKRVVSRRRS